MISSQLQLIASLCRSSQLAVKNAFDNFGTNRLFIPVMIREDALSLQVDAIFDGIRTEIIDKQGIVKDLFQYVQLVNQILSGLHSNYLYLNVNDSNSAYHFVK